jgi:hypothetical protein
MVDSCLCHYHKTLRFSATFQQALVTYEMVQSVSLADSSNPQVHDWSMSGRQNEYVNIMRRTPAIGLLSFGLWSLPIYIFIDTGTSRRIGQPSGFARIKVSYQYLNYKSFVPDIVTLDIDGAFSWYVEGNLSLVNGPRYQVDASTITSLSPRLLHLRMGRCRPPSFSRNPPDSSHAMRASLAVALDSHSMPDKILMRPGSRSLGLSRRFDGHLEL